MPSPDAKPRPDWHPQPGRVSFSRPHARGMTMAEHKTLTQPRGLVLIGGGFVLVVLAVAAVVMFLSLPDANVFNDRVAQIFAENDALVNPSEINLLMVLGQSGTTFAEVLSSYRLIILVLLVLSFCLLLSSLYFLLTNAALTSPRSN
jgi:hypothetical protein